MTLGTGWETARFLYFGDVLLAVVYNGRGRRRLCASAETDALKLA
jgi:hypothetical protein